MSLVGALSHLGKVAPTIWFKSVIAYTVSGLVSATVVGGGIGFIGYALTISPAWWFIGLVALGVALRDWGLVRFRLPECRRQTEKRWAHNSGFVIASFMWGFHIGLGFATYVKYGGFWILTLIAIAWGRPDYGAALLGTYWIGRTLSVWIAPLLRNANDVGELMMTMVEQCGFLSTSSGLACVALAAIVILEKCQIATMNLAMDWRRWWDI